MSLGKRIREAFDRLREDDFEGAMIPVSIAVDSTASRTFPYLNNNRAYKQFVIHRMPIISLVATGKNVIHRINLQYDHPDTKPDAEGLVSIEQILYHVIRCKLLHEGSMPPSIGFGKDGSIKVRRNTITLPCGFIYGLVAAVVASPLNAHERTDSDYGFQFNEHKGAIDAFWGNEKLLMDWMETARTQTNVILFGGDAMGWPKRLPTWNHDAL